MWIGLVNCWGFWYLVRPYPDCWKYLRVTINICTACLCFQNVKTDPCCFHPIQSIKWNHHPMNEQVLIHMYRILSISCLRFDITITEFAVSIHLDIYMCIYIYIILYICICRSSISISLPSLKRRPRSRPWHQSGPASLQSGWVLWQVWYFSDPMHIQTWDSDSSPKYDFPNPTDSINHHYSIFPNIIYH